jgi:cytochrome bd-type quinol oxidase subunit 2
MTDQTPSPTPETPQIPATSSAPSEAQSRRQQAVIIGVVVLVMACFIGSLVFLLVTEAETTARIRDIFIIVMAFESLLVGFVLVILIVQLAKLTNLLQNEIKPILLSINETISTLRGTTAFLSDNLAEPVIKLNSYLAGLGELLSLIGLSRKSDKK